MWFAKQNFEKDWGTFEIKVFVEECTLEKHDKIKNKKWFKMYKNNKIQPSLLTLVNETEMANQIQI
jgi:hypothetical protein